jgi:hypothetical protein
MQHLFDIACDVAIGAALLLGAGLIIDLGSSVLELIALR